VAEFVRDVAATQQRKQSHAWPARAAVTARAFFFIQPTKHMKSGFVFYRSWLDSMSLMTEEERNELLWVILRMGLYNEEPKQMSRMVAISWSLIRTQMEVNNQRYENSIQRRQKQNESKMEAKQKQNESKTEAKQEQNESKTVAKEKVKEKEKEKEKVKVKVKEGEVDFSDFSDMDEFDKMEAETRRRLNLPPL